MREIWWIISHPTCQFRKSTMGLKCAWLSSFAGRSAGNGTLTT
jgi:hypothetical protein